MIEIINEYFLPLRYIHVLAGSLWIGEVFAINFILIPSLTSYQGEARKDFLNTVFPKVFRMASILSATAAISGLLIYYKVTGFEPELMFGTSQRKALTFGATLGVMLTLFHFFMENLLARKVGVGNPDLPMEQVEDVHGKLTIVPRVGMVVITMIFISMLYGVRGI